MKFKKFGSVLIFSLILILSLSMVSASDDVNDTITVYEDNTEISVDESAEELNAGSTIYISPEGTGTGSDENNPTNWNTALSKATSGDTIQFANGTYYNIQGTIYQSITLKGSGNSVLDANNAGGFITIGDRYSKTLSVTLDDLSFINAYTGEKQGNPDGPKTGYDGEGAIVNGGTLIVKNCYFASNQGIGTEGGAIHNAGTCYIYDSTFFGNGGKKGGAIYSDKGSSLYMYNSIVNKCVSKEGSAVHAKEAYVEIHNCSVVNASAKNGLFYIKKSRVYFYDSYFYNCRAVDAAAVINIDKESSVEIDNCIFNKLSSTGTKLWFHQENGTGNGGAIVVEKDVNNVVIKNSIFTNCTAKGEGGAIYIQSNTKITIDNCTFKSNYAGESGNHIYTYGSAYSLSISNSLFEIDSSISTTDIEYGEVENIAVTCDVGTNNILNPTIELLLNDNAVSTVNKVLNLPLADLTVGNYTVSLKATDSSNKYVFTQDSSIFVVGGENVEVTVNYAINEDGSINVKVVDEYGRNVANKNVVVTINGTEYRAVTDKSGIAVINPELGEGEYSVSVNVDGKVISNKSSTTISIKNSTTPLSDTVDVDFSYNDDGTFEVNVKDEYGRVIPNQNVSVTINGKTYTATTNSNGVAVITPTDTVAGEYSVSVSVEGKTVSDNSQTSVKILPSDKTSSIIASDLKRGYKSPYDFKARFLDKNANPLKNKEVTFIINGNEYNVETDEYGYATLSIGLNTGEYNVTALNPANGESKTYKLTVVARITGNKNVNVDYSYKATYKVRIFADNGKAVGAGETVVISIDGKKTAQVKTDKNGYVTYAVKNNKLLVKTHKITFEYKGVKSTSKLVVKQILKSKNVKVKKSAKTKKFTATLKTSKGKAIKGKKITFKIKGKKYTAKTNKKGVATIKIKQNLKVRKYTVSVTYLKNTIKKTLTIKK